MTKKCDCHDINDDEWDVIEHDWSDKKFYAVGIPIILHVPVKIGSRYGQLKKEVQQKGYELMGPLQFVQKDGLFRGLVMAEIKDPGRPDPKVVTFGENKIWSKVYYGSWRYLNTAVKELMEQSGEEFKNVYFWYVTCPVCSEEKGYKTVVFGEVE